MLSWPSNTSFAKTLFCHLSVVMTYGISEEHLVSDNIFVLLPKTRVRTADRSAEHAKKHHMRHSDFFRVSLSFTQSDLQTPCPCGASSQHLVSSFSLVCFLALSTVRIGYRVTGYNDLPGIMIGLTTIKIKTLTLCGPYILESVVHDGFAFI